MSESLHELDGPRAKLVRAAQQSHTLSKHCQAYEESRPMTLEVAWEDDAHFVYLRPRFPPRYLGLILGELVHDLRSALDQVAWALAATHAGEALDRPKAARAISFPISSTEEAFRSHPALPYFDPEAVTVMEHFQPYKNAEIGTHRLNPLAVVQDWSNTDKHRVLQQVLGRLELDDLRFQASVQIDLNDVEMLQGDSIVLDTTQGLLRIPAPPTARIVFEPAPAHVRFPSFVRDPPEPLDHANIGQIVVQIGECVDAFTRFFPDTDWSLRTESWVTPEL